MPIGCRSEIDDLDRRRQRAPERRVAHPRRREQPPAPDVEVGPQQALAAQAARARASTSPFDSRSFPRTTMWLDLQHARVRDAVAPLDGDDPQRDHDATPTPAAVGRDAAPAAAARRAGLTCARRNRRSAGAATGTHVRASAPVRAPRRSRSATPPIEPAPSVITTSPGPRPRGRSPAPRRRASARRRPAPARCARIGGGQRVDRDAGNRILAGRVDVGEHDVVGAGQRRAERVHAAPPSACSGAAGTPRRSAGPARGPPRARPRSRSDDGRSRRRRGRRSARRAPRSAARRRGTPSRPAAMRSNGRPSSRPTATAASAFCRLCRPGTASASVPSVSTVRRRAVRRRARGAVTVAVDASAGPSTTSVAVTSASAASRPYVVTRRVMRGSTAARFGSSRTRPRRRRTAPCWRSRRTPAAGRRSRRSSRGARGRCS